MYEVNDDNNYDDDDYDNYDDDDNGMDGPSL